MAKSKKSELNLTQDHEDDLKKHLETRDKIQRVFDYWRYRLWLGPWSITLHYEWNGIDQSRRDLSILATCSARWMYLEADITFDMPLISCVSDQKLEEIVVHEMIHILVNEMRERGIDHEERVVTLLTNAFLTVKKGVIE